MDQSMFDYFFDKTINPMIEEYVKLKLNENQSSYNFNDYKPTYKNLKSMKGFDYVKSYNEKDIDVESLMYDMVKDQLETQYREALISEFEKKLFGEELTKESVKISSKLMKEYNDQILSFLKKIEPNCKSLLFSECEMIHKDKNIRYFRNIDKERGLE